MKSAQEQKLIRLVFKKKKAPSRTYASLNCWETDGVGYGLPRHEWHSLKLVIKEFKTMEKTCSDCGVVMKKGTLCIGVRSTKEMQCVACFKKAALAAVRDVEMLTDSEQRKRFDFSEAV